jgi:class 3 adenylate cyclase
MEWPPDISYAASADGTNLAYAVLSDGDRDILLAIGMATNLGIALSEVPGLWRFYERLANAGRLIVYDQRGSGRSDPIPLNESPPVERRTEDMEAILDATGSSTAAVVAVTAACAPAILLAATKPDRVASLALYGSYARVRAAPDYPMGLPDEVVDAFVQMSSTEWGGGSMLELIAPSHAQDPPTQEWYAQVEKLQVSPAQSAALNRMSADTDVREALGLVQAPTLVLHRQGDRLIDIAHARYIAEHVPGARMVELEGEDHAFFSDPDELLDEIEEFITGHRGEGIGDRVLTTVLITDIVASTEKARELGDHQWRQVLDQHDRVVRRQLDRFGGRLIKTTGDGLMATFDGPAKAVLCASAIRDGVKALGLDLRAGVHTGEVEVRGDDIGGIGVHIAARIATAADPGQVWTSRTVRDLATGSGIEFRSIGLQSLRGVGEDWELYTVPG